MKKTLYQVVCASFCVIVVVSNILSAKMVMIPWINIVVPAGLITYPCTFLLSDFVTEFFGAKKARLMIYMVFFMSLLSLLMIQIGLLLPADSKEVGQAFQMVLGLSAIRTFASLISYIVSQIVDIQLYAAIKRWTGCRWLWLRNNGSTFVSQLVDTILIDLIFLWWGVQMHFKAVLPIMLFSFCYKALFSLACTPLFYCLVFVMKGVIKGKWNSVDVHPRDKSKFIEEKS